MNLKWGLTLGRKWLYGDGVSGIVYPGTFNSNLKTTIVPQKASSGTSTLTRSSTATVMGYAEAAVSGASQVLLTIPANIPRFAGARFLSSNNTWSSVLADGTAISEATLKGGLIEGVRSNRFWPCATPSTWIIRGTATAVTGALNPFGGTTGQTVTVGTTNVNDIYRNHTGFTASAAIAVALWIKRVSTSGTLVVTSPYGPTKGNMNIDLSLLPDEYIYLKTSHSAVSVTNAWVGDASGGQGVRFYSLSGNNISFIFGGVSLEEAPYSSSYIPTTTAAVTRATEVLLHPTDSNIIAATGSITLDFTPEHAPSGTIALWGSYVDASNYTAILHDATNYIFRKRIAGVNYDATVARTFVSGTKDTIVVNYSADGSTISVNEENGVSQDNGDPLQLGATFQIGADGNSLQQPFGEIKNVIFYDSGTVTPGGGGGGPEPPPDEPPPEPPLDLTGDFNGYFKTSDTPHKAISNTPTTARASTVTVLGFNEADVTGSSLKLITVPSGVAAFKGARFLASNNTWSNRYADGQFIDNSILKGRLLEPAGANLFQNSNAFDTAPNVSNNGTPTYNASDDSWTLTGTFPYMYQLVALTAASTYTRQMLVKKTVGVQTSYPVVAVQNAAATTIALATIDTTNGTITEWTEATDFALFPGSVTIADAGNGYWHVVQNILAAATENHYFSFFPSGASTETKETGSLESLTGGATFKYAQVETGGQATSYIPRVTAAATRAAATLSFASSNFGTGNTTSTNLLPYSDDFSQADWAFSTRGNKTVNTGNEIYGQTRACLIDEGTATSTHNLNSPTISVTSGSTYTLSIFAAKNGTNKIIQLAATSTRFNVECYANFDLDAGTVTKAGTAVTASGIVAMPNGMYRCYMSGVASDTGSATSLFAALVNNDPDATRLLSYAGASKSLFIYGAQINAGTISEYAPTGAAGASSVVRSSFSIKFKVTPSVTLDTATFISSMNNADNGVLVCYEAGKFILRKRVGGTNYDCSVTMAALGGTEYSVEAAYSSDGSAIIVNGVGGSGYNGSATIMPKIGSTIKVASDFAGTIGSIAPTRDIIVAHASSISFSAISSIVSGQVNSTSQDISWALSIAGTGQVEYGLSTVYGTFSTKVEELKTSHSTRLTGLLPETTYHYRVRSITASNVETLSADQTFTTAAAVSETVTMPSLYGMTKAVATTTITGLGLVLGTVTGINGTVCEQSLAVGSTVIPGSSVGLFVGQNVATYGAVGNGSTNDTTAIKNAIAASNTGDIVYVPTGTFMCDQGTATNIKPKSGVNIYLSASSILRAVPISGANNVQIIRFDSQTNVKIYGTGTVQGDRSTHIVDATFTGSWATNTLTVTAITGIITPSANTIIAGSGVAQISRITAQLTSTESGGVLGGRGTYTVSRNLTLASQSFTSVHGEHGMGIGIYGGSGLTIDGPTIKDCFGDGIYVGGACSNILIKNVLVTTCRRNNVSIVQGNGITLQDSEISYANGTSPQIGVDVEPNAGTTLTNVVIERITAHHNSSRGIHIAGLHSAMSNVTVRNNKAYNNSEHGISSARGVGMTNILIQNNEAYSNALSGFAVYQNSSGGVTLSGNNSHNNTQHGIALYNNSNNNLVNDNHCHFNTGWGITLYNQSGYSGTQGNVVNNGNNAHDNTAGQIGIIASTGTTPSSSLNTLPGAGPTQPTITFNGGFTGGTLTGSGNTNWMNAQDTTNSLHVIESDGAGGYQAKFSVLPSGASNTERSEVAQMQTAANAALYETEASGTVVYEFQSKLDSTWRAMANSGGNGRWAIICQCHGPDSLSTNPVWAIDMHGMIVSIRGGNINVNTSGADVPMSDQTLALGQWVKWKVTVKYDKTTAGSLKVERMNTGASVYTTVYNNTAIATLQFSNAEPTVGNHYMKIGLYRNYESFTSIVTHKGFIRYVIA